MPNTFYVTTPIYYANSLPHLGHLYTTIVADALTRHKKQRGYETYFLTGTDEHGLNIQRAAEAKGISPKEHVDGIVAKAKEYWSKFGLDEAHGGYNIFMRTTEPFHYEGVKHLWQEIAKNKTPKGNDNIYKGHYEGWFCAPCAAFKTETEYYFVDGSDIPLCKDHERPLDKISEESYFFRLSDYADKLIEVIEQNPDRIRPEARRNEILSFIRGGLQDLSISREKSAVEWGIPVPGDDTHTIYVWLDALTNYITAIGYPDNARDGVNFEKYWSNVFHLVGKDILRFHTVYWWSFLLAAGVPLPTGVYAHGMWLDGEGRKMSKTLGNSIELPTLLNNFPNDPIRYFCLREMVFGQDGKFSYENLIDRTNSDLASGLGNLSSRTLTMIRNYCGGAVPDGNISEPNFLVAKRHGIQPDAQELATVLKHGRDEFLKQIDNYEFSRALETAWAMMTRIDKFLSDAKPWDLAKDESLREVLQAVLYRAAEGIRWLCVLLYPVLPDSARNIYGQLGLSSDLSTVNPENLKWGELAAGTKIGEIKAVFPRLDKKKIMEEINASEQNAVSSGGSHPKNAESANDEGQMTKDEFITIDDFLKVDLRVGTILSAEKVSDADKLLLFKVDIGEAEPRQIMAGLAIYYQPEKLVGRKIVVVANLKPRKMRGLMSQGMVCAASLSEEDTPALATFVEDVANGARLK
jgi:methionyl-tRNA synthetase